MRGAERIPLGAVPYLTARSSHGSRGCRGAYNRSRVTDVLALVPPRIIATIATMTISTMIRPATIAVVVLMPSTDPPGADG